VIRSLFYLGGWELALVGFFQFIGAMSVFCAPLALMFIVRFITNFQPHDEIPNHIIFCTAVLFLGPVIQSIADAQVRKPY